MHKVVDSLISVTKYSLCKIKSFNTLRVLVPTESLIIKGWNSISSNQNSETIFSMFRQRKCCTSGQEGMNMIVTKKF